MQALDMSPGQSQIPQATSQQGRCQMKLGSEKPKADNQIPSLMPDAVPYSSQMENAKRVQPINFYPSI